MASRQKVNEAVERLARTTHDSYEKVVDHAVAMQERNVRFAQHLVNGSITEMREQAESNRAMALELVERADKQRDSFQGIVEESLDAYMDVAFAPLSYYKEGLTVAGRAAR